MGKDTRTLTIITKHNHRNNMKKTLFCLYMMLCGFGLSLLAQNNPTIKLPDYNEIVSNYKYIGIEQREGKANLEDFTALCKGQLSYLKKDQGDELDKLLYLESPEFETDRKKYEELKEQVFYTYFTSPQLLNFTTQGFFIYAGYRPAYGVSGLAGAVAFPHNKRYVKDANDFYPKWWFPIENLQVLKLLKERQDHLGIMVIVKPGCRIDDSFNVGIPLGLYIFDKDAKEILYDASYALGKYSEIELFRVAKIERNKRDTEWNTSAPYHKRAKRVICFLCHGSGVVMDYSNGHSQRSKCAMCHGAGFYSTHYYDD